MDVTDTPVLSVEGPRSVPSRISMVLVDGTMSGDTPGRECPREDEYWRPRAGETRPAGVFVGGGDSGLPRTGETLSSPDVAGRSLPVVPAGGSSSVGAADPAGPDGPVVAGGPVGPRVTLSPLFPDALGPLEHSVLDHAGPVGRHVAVGPVGKDETLQGLDPLEHSDLDHADPVGQCAAVGQVGQFGMLSPSDCHPAGPAGPYVAGGPVGPDDSLQVLDPLELSVLDHADPAGQRSAVGPVGLFGTMSPSDCHPAGPAGPYVAGGPVGPDEEFQVLDPLEHSDPEHADPAGQHAVFQDVLEPLEHMVLDTALDGRPMEGFPVLGPIEHSVLEITPAGRLLPVDVTDTPVLSVEGPRSVPSRISMVLVDGTMAGDTPGRECPREDEYWRPRAGETRPAGVSVGGGDSGLPHTGETLSSPDVAGRSLPVVPAGGSSSVGAADPAGPDGPVVAGGPVGLCGMLSPLFPDSLGPLEHSVLDHAGPVGWHVAVGPVGTDETLQGLDPLVHSDLDHADPVGQRAAVGHVGLFGTMSPSYCHPAGPAGPYVAGGPVGPQMKSFKFWIR